MTLLRVLIFLCACSGGDGCGHVCEIEERFGRGRWDEGEVGSLGKCSGKEMIGCMIIVICVDQSHSPSRMPPQMLYREGGSTTLLNNLLHSSLS